MKITNRPIFEPTHNCICAYADMPILEFYKEYYDCVYIILHPFTNLEDKSKIVTWSEFIALANLKGYKQLDIALRNSIGGLVEKHKNDVDVELLNTVCEKYKLMPPSEGAFQRALIKNMLLGIIEQGHEHMFIADEWGTERKHFYPKELLDYTETRPLAYHHENWYTPRNEILYTTHWDSFFTLLCSDKKTVEAIVGKYQFEGFYCDENTEIYWSVRD